jgi:hypothetical protein
MCGMGYSGESGKGGEQCDGGGGEGDIELAGGVSYKGFGAGLVISGGEKQRLAVARL